MSQPAKKLPPDSAIPPEVEQVRDLADALDASQAEEMIIEHRWDENDRYTRTRRPMTDLERQAFAERNPNERLIPHEEFMATVRAMRPAQ